METAQGAARTLNGRYLSGRPLRVEQVRNVDKILAQKPTASKKVQQTIPTAKDPPAEPRPTASKEVQQTIPTAKDQPAEPEPESLARKTMLVGNVPSYIDLKELRELLSASGVGVETEWRSPHSVQAVFASEGNASLAYSTLQGTFFHGHYLQLSMVPPPKEKKRPAEDALEGPKPKKMHFDDAVVLVDVEGTYAAPVRWFPQKCGNELVRGTIEEAIRKHAVSRHARDVLRYLFERDTASCADPASLPDCLHNLTDQELGIELVPNIVIIDHLDVDFK